MAEGLAFFTIPVLLILGFRHAFDVDHLAAVTSLVSKRRQHVLDAVGIGGGFALGHLLSALVFGGVGVLVGVSVEALAPAVLQQFARVLAGVMTMVLGVWIVRGCASGTCHRKLSRYRMVDWSLPEIQAPNHLVFRVAGLGFVSVILYKSVYKVLYVCTICLSNWVGLLYSVAPPIPAIVAVAVVGATGDGLFAFSLALAYGGGIMAGMSIVGLVEGTLFEHIWRRKRRVHNDLMWILGVVILSVGAYLLLSNFMDLPRVWEHL